MEIIAGVQLEQPAKEIYVHNAVSALFTITNVSAERWQRALLAWKHNKLPQGLVVELHGVTGTVHRDGNTASTFAYQPLERALRVERVTDSELEHYVRQWFGF